MKYMDLIPGDYSNAPQDRVFSVPMEAHIVAANKDDALIIATHLPTTLHANDGSGPHTLIVATDDADNVDVIE